MNREQSRNTIAVVDDDVYIGDMVEEILEKMDMVNYSSVKAVIDEIFDADQFSFSAVGNIEDIDFEGMINEGKQFLYNQNR